MKKIFYAVSMISCAAFFVCAAQPLCAQETGKAAPAVETPPALPDSKPEVPAAPVSAPKVESPAPAAVPAANVQPAPVVPAPAPAVNVQPAAAVPAPAPAVQPAAVPAPAVVPPPPAPAEAAPAPKTEPAAAPKAEEAGQLSLSAQSLAPLAEGYKKAYESLELWIKEVSAQTKAADDKITGINVKIQDNEGTATKLKLESEKANKVRIKELNKENKTLWTDLKMARKDKSVLSASLSKTAAAKVAEFAMDIKLRLKDVQIKLKE